MAINKPTLNELDYRIKTDIKNALNTQNVTNSVHDKLASALAAVSYGLYNYIDMISNQITPINATGVYLQKWFDLFDIIKKSSAVATGYLLIAKSATAITLPVNTIFSTSDGLQYQTTTTTTLSTTSATSLEVSSLSAGYKYNLSDGTALTSNVLPNFFALSDNIGGGADQENSDDMRSRLLQKIRYGNNSGNAGDYEAWAREIVGVGRAWCVDSGAGFVNVFIASNSKRNPAANKSLIQIVQTALDKKKPLGIKELLVFSAIGQKIDFTIATQIQLSDQQKLRIETILADYIYANYDLTDSVDIDDFSDVLDTQIYKYNAVINTGNLPCLGDVKWI